MSVLSCLIMFHWVEDGRLGQGFEPMLFHRGKVGENKIDLETQGVFVRRISKAKTFVIPSNMEVRVPSKMSPKQPLENVVHAPPCPKSGKYVSSWLWVTDTKPAPQYSIEAYKKKTVVQSALMPHHSIEKMVSKKTSATPFYRGCFGGATCTPRIYIYKTAGCKCRPEVTEG